MNIVQPKAHRVLDFITVIVFAAAPAVLGLHGIPAYLAYALAAVHLAVTLVTQFPGDARRPLPLAAHGGLELVVGAILVALPFVLGWAGVARVFYVVMGGVILVAFAATIYRPET